MARVLKGSKFYLHTPRVCGAHGTCLVAANVVFSRWWSYQRSCASPNSFAGFKGPLRGGKEKGKGKEERGKDMKKRD